MTTGSLRSKPFKSTLRAAVRLAALAAAITVVGTAGAWAYVGKSFLQVPGVKGDWKGTTYQGWVSAEANLWKVSRGARGGGGGARGRPETFFSYPNGPRQGEGQITLALSIKNPAVPALVDRCLKKTVIPEMTYAESSDMARQTHEIGARPADIPAYYEYKMKDVQITDCPVADGAPERPFVITFKDIAWANFQGEGEGKMLTVERAVLPPAQTSGITKTFALNWYAPAHDAVESMSEQCSALSDKPTEADYYALFTKEEEARERVRLAPAGGPSATGNVICMRGPHQINACALPGIVKDPGQPEPITKIARGLNLDGDDGTGPAPAGTCKHQNYMSADGEKGIDNQLYRVEGCMRGYQGHKGQLYQYANEQRRNGLVAILLQVSGIDDEKNDNNVDVSVYYSQDPMEKNAGGEKALPDVTFRVSDKPEIAHFFARMKGRIVNGVLTTDPIPELKTNLRNDTPIKLHNVRMRLEFMPDGGVKGLMGGYQDWRNIATSGNSGTVEALIGASTPAMYNALKRAADGGKDPVTGECNEISTAYDLEGVPAFIPVEQQKRLLTQK